MAVYQALLLNTVVPQIQAAQAGDSYVMVVNATTPALRITQTGTGNAISVEDEANPDSSPFVVTSAGDVGIGTSSPGSKLDVLGGVSSTSDWGNVNITSRNVINSANRIYAGLKFQDSGSGDAGAIGYSYNGTGYNMFFGTVASVGGAVTTRLAITSTGEFQWKPDGTTQAMTLDASGRLLIGPTSASSGARATLTSAAQASGAACADSGILLYPTANLATGEYAPFITWSGNFSNPNRARAAIGAVSSGTNTALDLVFLTRTAADASEIGTGSERARITSGGYFKASNSGAYLNSTATYHEINQTANDNILFIRSTDANYSVDGVQLRFNRNTTNNTFYALSYYNDAAAAYKFRVADSGDVTNTNGTYGTISDQKMKTDIVDAGSQWSDIKALRFRKFKMKDDPSGLVQLGVVAQEVELTSPGLVDEHQDRDAEGNDLGTTTKSVKTSVLLMKAAVALQEAMARIETLEAKIAALEAK
jgi:hypothetical protein